ncbi:MAG: AarF/ABC1/UbiB kinase family protein [Bacteroidia bacterium]|nr:AarF/ABC1/UbiB kinase family protein [Bacteroidia bacterium]
MAQDEIPTGKIDRASRFLKTGLRMGGNYMRHVGKKALLQPSTSDDLDRANGQAILEEFTKLRGTALKMAQMLSMDSVNLSQAFTNVLQQAQSSVPPMSAPMAINTFKKSVGKYPEEVFDRFNPLAVAAASMGQVHEAWKDGRRLAVKVQYPGVAESIQSDMAIVKRFAPTFVKASAKEMEPYFEEVESKLLEETDYTYELASSMAFKDACQDLPGVEFPDYFPEYSGKRVLTMSWLEGLHLRPFLDENPSQALKNQVAQTVWDLYEHQVHVLKRVNADPHPGNFLFRLDGTVGLLDFGCTKTFSGAVYDDYFKLADPNLYNDPQTTDAALRKLSIIREDDTPERLAYLTPLFARLIQLMSKPLSLGEFYFGDESYYEEVAALGKEIAKLREVRGSKEYLFINRTFFGLFSIMRALDAHVVTKSKYLQFDPVAA